MNVIDYIVLCRYCLARAGIGGWAMGRVHGQEDFFMGGRQFGKLFQTFAAFGAGTGSADPVNTARGTFASGMSGMWGVMYWLFVTPVYCISAVWYRRLRCLTLGDWFTERYESPRLGAAYALFGCFYYMTYGAMLFTAIGKVAAPLLGDTLFGVQLEYVLLPLIAVIISAYGLLGGLAAAYWTDLIQGVCIILLSVLLIPFGLSAVVEKFGQEGDTWTDGFRIMHEQLPESSFTILGAEASSEFPLYAIVCIVIINMVGIVLTPHFLVTGGGTAKNEFDARMGLVSGNLIKRFCTIGWVITALIVLTLFSSRPELIADPDQAWGTATKELLGPLGIGLVGLMLACLLAALMSSVDCYMLVCSALVVRNIYVPFVNSDAKDSDCVNIARVVGLLVVGGSVAVALTINDMFANLQLTWIVPMLFAAVFWTGMYWRKATTAAAWITFTCCLLFFFAAPILLPIVSPDLRKDADLTRTTHVVQTMTSRPASPSDVEKRRAEIDAWTAESGSPEPEPLRVGDLIQQKKRRGGIPLFWTGKVFARGGEQLEDIRRRDIDNGTETVSRHTGSLEASGRLRLEMLVLDRLGLDLESMSSPAIKTLDLPFATIVPFLLMIVASLLTKPNSKEALDRLYVRMKTPVDSTPEEDREELEKSYADPTRFDDRKLFPGSSLEFQRPTLLDAGGFLGCFVLCFGIIGLVFYVAQIGT